MNIILFEEQSSYEKMKKHELIKLLHEKDRRIHFLEHELELANNECESNNRKLYEMREQESMNEFTKKFNIGWNPPFDE